MLSKPIPPWILYGGGLLAAVAGCVNAIGFVGIHHQALSHMSGSAAIFSAGLAVGDTPLAFHALLVLCFFFLGSVLSGIIIRQRALTLSPRYGVALLIESALLFGATYFLHHASNTGDYLAAMACGLQNAIATTYSGAIIRTTHITGIITDLGISVGNVLRRQRVDQRRTLLHLILVSGFIIGGFVGAFGYARFGFSTLLLPATLTGLAGAAYPLLRRYLLSPSP
jgi:uncharacterized membrane protein YoaK (UPF0700 family)